MPMSIAIAAGSALLISVLLSTLLTSLTVNGSISETAGAIGVFVIRALSVLAGGLVGCAIVKEQYLPVIGLTAAAYLIVLLGLGIVLYDGSFQKFGTGILSVLIGAAIACLIKLMPWGRKNRRLRIAR